MLRLPHLRLARGAAALALGVVWIAVIGHGGLNADAAATAGAAVADGAAGAAADAVPDAAAAALAHVVAQVERGAAVYAFSCAVCHGNTGLGFEEARSAFPEDHRNCFRCHHPNNAPQMPGSEIMGSVMAFSLGDPPPLADAARLARFGTAGALLHYVRATMPRWDPGRLDDDAYLDVVAHLLRMTGRLAVDELLTPDRLDLNLGE